MTALRSIVFNVFFFVVTGLSSIVVGMPALLLPRRFAAFAIRIWARTVLGALRWTVGLDWELRGDARALARPGVLAVKHQSTWDTIVFFAIASDPAYVLKKELLLIPFYGWVSIKAGMIGVDRGKGGAAIRAMTKGAKRAIADGRQVVIFPQGTRVAPGAAVPYHPGVAALYGQLDVPVTPVALNSGLFWGRRSFVKRPGRIVVEILPPIPPGLDRKTFMTTLETAIETASARLAAEAAR